MSDTSQKMTSMIFKEEIMDTNAETLVMSERVGPCLSHRLHALHLEHQSPQWLSLFCIISGHAHYSHILRHGK